MIEATGRVDAGKSLRSGDELCAVAGRLPHGRDGDFVVTVYR